MNILMTVSYYSPYISGLTIHVSRLARAFTDRNYSVHILTTRYDKKLLSELTDHGINVIRVPYTFKFSKGFIMITYPWYVLKQLVHTDTVLINLPQFEGFIPAFFGRILGKKVICIYHCELVLPSGMQNFVIQNIVSVSHILTLIFANTVVTYTEDYADHSKILPYFTHKVKTIYPPVPLPKKDADLTEAIRRRIPDKTKYIIGVAARFAAEKGIEYLIEAIPLIKKELGNDFIILFAGPEHPVGEESYWESMQPKLTKYKDVFIFAGTIPQEKMGSFYSLLEILILPSVNSTEAFGMVQVEAMLCGVPVAASDLPGVREPVRATGMGEIIRCKDYHDIAEKIVKILLHKEDYIKSRKFIESKFSLQNTLDSFEATFSRLTS